MEMVASFGKTKRSTIPLQLDGSNNAQSTSFKYLGTALTDDFDFNKNWEARVSKSRQRLYSLKRLQYTTGDEKIMRKTYQSSSLY